MTILAGAIALFVVMETANVVTLYWKPGARIANGVGVFDAWERSKADPQLHRFVSYLVYWVAGTKLIFIALLLVIIATGGQQTQVATVAVLILSILSFFWRLFPLARQLDQDGQLTPKGYSRSLGLIIGGMIVVFSAALVLALI